jgi:hypothetical protein
MFKHSLKKKKKKQLNLNISKVKKCTMQYHRYCMGSQSHKMTTVYLCSIQIHIILIFYLFPVSILETIKLISLLFRYSKSTINNLKIWNTFDILVYIFNTLKHFLELYYHFLKFFLQVMLQTQQMITVFSQ